MQKRPLTLSVIWILLQAMGTNALCQQQQISFTHLSTDQGLSQSNVTCILQDRHGFMWFGTRDGLNKYDGYEFTIYKNKAGDPGSLNNNFITSILEDRNGVLWIGTWGGGVNRLDKQKDQFTQYRRTQGRSTSHDFINSLALDQSGNIWIGTDGGGLDVLNPLTGQFTSYIHDSNDPGSISDNDVTHIVQDSRQRIWVGTSRGGLNLFNKEQATFIHYQHNEKDSLSLSNNEVWRIYEDNHRRLWIGTRGGGLNLFDPQEEKFHHFRNDPHNNNSLVHNVVLSLCDDDRGRLWIGTENGGISVLDPEKGIFDTYRHDDIDNSSLGSNSVYSLYRDTRGNIWVGTYSTGVDLFNKDAHRFVHYKHTSSPQSLSNNSVLTFYEDSKKKVWIGTDGGGLEMFEPGTGKFTHFRHSTPDGNSLSGDYVLSIHEDGDDNLWVGTWGDGLTVIDRQRHTFRHFRHELSDSGSLSGNNVYAITEDSRRNLWIGTYGDGLNSYDRRSNRFTRYRHDENPGSLSSDRIHTLMGDRKGSLWIGTFDGGLDRLDSGMGKFIHYRHEENRNSLSSNSVNYVYEDSRGNIWVCTAVGLNRLDRQTGRFTVYSTRDGLPNDMVFSILEDHNGNFWITTNSGLSCFDEQTRHFTNYSSADGLQSNEFKPHSCYKSTSGALYFGGVNGFNVFFPDSIKATAFRPPLVITGFQIFNREVPVTGGNIVSPLQQVITDTRAITLSHKSSVISFDFASLNYTVPEKKLYAYRLEGFDTGWNDIGMHRRATYTNLDPGKYVFKVRSKIDDESWSEPTPGILLTITPPFWHTWWFRILVILVTGGSVIAFHKIRMDILHAQKTKLEQQVAVLLDQAVAQEKYQIASNVLHDIGNAVVGFGSHLTRIRRLLEQDGPDHLQKLAGFFELQQPVLTPVIGKEKAGAVVTMLGSIARTQRHSQTEIHHAITEQLHIISHVQEILNIQRQYITGKESQERRPVNIRTVVNDCLSMLFAAMDKSTITVSFDVTGDPPTIKGDHTRLMQAILNILKNGMEAIPADAVEKTISLQLYTCEEKLILQVKDSGSGFDSATAGRLFEKGFTTRSTGAGLGLYNCRAIMESHDGSIDITSEGPGKGAVVTLTWRENR